MYPDARKVLRQALASGITGPQARVLLALLCEANHKGLAWVSLDDVAIASATMSPWRTINQVLSPWVTVVEKGSWLDLVPSLYRLHPEPESATGATNYVGDVVICSGGRFYRDDAFRDGSPLSAASGLLMHLSMTQGPWRIAALREALRVPERSMRRWVDTLDEVGLVRRSRGRIDSLVPVEEWQPLLDEVAERAGTLGSLHAHRLHIIRKREENEPERLKALARRDEQRRAQERMKRETVRAVEEFLKQAAEPEEEPVAEPEHVVDWEGMSEDVKDQFRNSAVFNYLNPHQYFFANLADEGTYPWHYLKDLYARIVASARATEWLDGSILRAIEIGWRDCDPAWRKQQKEARYEGLVEPLVDPIDVEKGLVEAREDHTFFPSWVPVVTDRSERDERWHEIAGQHQHARRVVAEHERERQQARKEEQERKEAERRARQQPVVAPGPEEEPPSERSARRRRPGGRRTIGG